MMESMPLPLLAEWMVFFKMQSDDMEEAHERAKLAAEAKDGMDSLNSQPLI